MRGWGRKSLQDAMQGVGLCTGIALLIVRSGIFRRPNTCTAQCSSEPSEEAYRDIPAVLLAAYRQGSEEYGEPDPPHEPASCTPASTTRERGGP